MGIYKRVLLKLSGESLGGPAGKGIDENWLAAYAEEVAQERLYIYLTNLQQVYILMT